MPFIVNLPVTSYFTGQCLSSDTGETFFFTVPRLAKEPDLTETAAAYNTYDFTNLEGKLPIICSSSFAVDGLTELLENAGLSGHEYIVIHENDMLLPNIAWKSFGFLSDPGFRLQVTAAASKSLIFTVVNSTHEDGDIWRTELCANYFKYSGGQFYYNTTAGDSDESNITGSLWGSGYLFDMYSAAVLIAVGNNIRLMPITPGATWASDSSVVLAPGSSPLKWAYSVEDMQAGTYSDGGLLRRFFSQSSFEHIEDIEGAGVSGGGSSSSSAGGSSSPYQYNTSGTDTAGIIGGDGDFTAFGDNESLDTLWTPGGIKLGLGIWLYQLTYTQLAGVVKALYSDNFADLLAKFFAGNVGNAVLRIYETNFQQDDDGTLASRDICLGSYNTGTQGTAISQFQSIVLPAVTLSDYFGSFADYDTELYIWLPYVGFRQLSPDKYMNRKNSPATITIQYRIDYLSGLIVYNVIGNGITGDSTDTQRNSAVIMDTFSGNIACDIPIGGSSMSSYIQNLLNAVNTGINTVAGMAGSDDAIAAGVAAVGGLASVGTSALNARRQTITSGGSVGSTLGALTSQDIYMLVIRPAQHMAANRPHYSGIVTQRTLALSDCDGYIECEDVYLTGRIPERARLDIISKMKAGVYI